MLTGILRIAKESIFSGLNNLRVYALLHPRYGDSFGFTEAEVVDLAGRAGYRGQLAELRDWYNGYLFGEQVIYNPWSIVNALADGRCSVYWVNTSSNDLIDELLMGRGDRAHEELELMLRGAGVRKPILENTVLARHPRCAAKSAPRQACQGPEDVWQAPTDRTKMPSHDPPVQRIWPMQARRSLHAAALAAPASRARAGRR